MPILYRISDNGHFIHAFAEPPVTKEEFMDYEVAHAIDKRIKPPVHELLEIYPDALKDITLEHMKEVLQRRSEVKHLPQPHRCAISIHRIEDHSLNLVKFYRGMIMLHYPAHVNIFANTETAKNWLGLDNTQPKNPDTTNGP
jgi:hypothetical protein